MRLCSLRLQNFQCFEDSGNIPIHDMTIFIGENDCGKTSILRALNLVFNNVSMDEEIFSDINGNKKKAIIVSMSFQINNSELDLYPRKFIINDGTNNFIKIKKCYGKQLDNRIKQTAIIEQIVLKREEYNRVETLLTDPLREIFEARGIDYPDQGGVSARNEAREILQNWIDENFESLEKKGIEWSKLDWSAFSIRFPRFEAYQSSDYASPIRLISNTLSEVYKSFFYDYDEETGISTLKEEYQILRRDIASDMDKKIEQELKEKVKKIIGKIEKISGRYSINFGTGFTLSDIVVDYGHGERSIDLIGEGTKKRLRLAIMEWDQEIKMVESHNNIIRFYDEPDSSLHYSAQKTMYYLLKSLSERDEMQILINTHSLAMIDRAPPRIINHIQIKDDKSSISILEGSDEDDIRDFLYGISTITGIKNSILFFERCFLIVEGDTEINALPIIYNKLNGKTMSEDGVVIINLENNATWEPFLKLLNKNRSHATLLFLDREIQTNRDRRITPEKLRVIGFDQDFVDENLILVGENEFEDIFSNEHIASCMDLHYPKLNSENWGPDEIEALREEGKFSSRLQQFAEAYLADNAVTWDRFRKPDFGRYLAKDLSPEQLSEIPELTSLMEKIASIID